MRLFGYFNNQHLYLSNRQFFARKRGDHARWEHLCEIDDFLFLIFEVGWCGRSVTSKINNYTSAIVHLLFPAELDMEDMREM
jgi:hypothetical protein